MSAVVRPAQHLLESAFEHLVARGVDERVDAGVGVRERDHQIEYDVVHISHLVDRQTDKKTNSRSVFLH